MVLYLILGVAGGVTYLMYKKNAPEKFTAAPAKQEQQTQNNSPSDNVTEPTEKVPEVKAEGEPTEEKLGAAERRINELSAGMETIWINGNKLYHYEQDPRPPTGVYWRPFILENKWGPLMKNDIYFYASISDGGFYDWIRGDALTVEAGDYVGTLYLPAKERHDKLSSDAESLFENYVLDADAEVLSMYRAIRQAQGGRITYYNTNDGKSLTSYLTDEEVSHISNMIELYDLLVELYR